MKMSDKDGRSPAQRARQEPLQKRLLNALANWCLLLGGVACIAIGGIAALRGESVIAGVAWGAGVLFLLGANVERFESLKGLGIEAVTRKIDDKIAEADDALERIRELSERTGASLVVIHSKIGRWVEPSTAESYALAQEVKANLESIGSSEETVRAALDPWVKVTCGDVLSGLSRAISKEMEPKVASLHLQRAARLVELNGDESKSPELRDQLEAVAAFSRRLDQIRSLDLQTLPDGFLKLYDEVPLIDREKASELRVEATTFMPVILSIRDELTIPDPARWCAEIDKLLERASR